jgi:hypothetical protein
LTIYAHFVINNQCVYEVKLNKINHDGTQEDANLAAAANGTKKFDTKAGQYFVIYYNSVQVGVMKIDLTADF